jgi:hypothetical protein
MITAESLFEDMQGLLVYTKSLEFDSKVFGIKSKNFTDRYKRVNQETQGAYHELWYEYMKTGNTR